MRVKVKGKWYDVDKMNSSDSVFGSKVYFYVENDKFYAVTNTFSDVRCRLVKNEVIIGEVEEYER